MPKSAMGAVHTRDRAHAPSLEVAPECLVGDVLEVRLVLPPDGLTTTQPHPMDWIGVYPASIPTLPGISHGRWVYLETAEAVSAESADIAPPGQRDTGTAISGTQPSIAANVTHGHAPKVAWRDALPAGNTLLVRFSPERLPPHAGEFEVRFHRRNGYGIPEASAHVTFLRAPRSWWRRGLLFAVLLLLVFLSQKALNAKGTCDFRHPDHHDDYIQDHFFDLTRDANHFMASNRHLAAAAQAVVSALLDLSMVVLLLVGAFQRSTSRPFLALFFMMAFRFVAQAIATMPCPPGYLWPAGKVRSRDV